MRATFLVTAVRVDGGWLHSYRRLTDEELSLPLRELRKVCMDHVRLVEEDRGTTVHLAHIWGMYASRDILVLRVSQRYFTHMKTYPRQLPGRREAYEFCSRYGAPGLYLYDEKSLITLYPEDG